MVEQQRFLRLQHLLKQSNIYSKFLLQRMEEQRERQEREDKLKRDKAQRKKVVNAKQRRKVCTNIMYIGTYANSHLT